MLRSMTGFASEHRTTDTYDITMELKSVNSRYFEFKLKSPNLVDEFENDIKNAVFDRLKRGKIDFFLKIVEKSADNYEIVVNEELADKYTAAIRRLCARTNVSPELTVRDLVTLPSVLQLERTRTDDTLLSVLLEMIASLLDKAVEMMRGEGAKTVEDIRNSVETIRECVVNIEKIYPDALDKYKKGLSDRVQELLGAGGGAALDQNRLLMEVELYASRSAINEEIVRLKSHMEQVSGILSGKIRGDAKKLDFISQEMNRETNTIASKSLEYGIVENTITMKGEIEKIREQLRNLE